MRYMVETYEIKGNKIETTEHETPDDAGKSAIDVLKNTGWVVEVRITDRERQKHQR